MTIENAEPMGAVDLAALLGLHERQVRKLAERGVIERDGRGRYVMADAVRSYCAHLREQAAGRAAGDGEEGAPDLSTERALLARAQREGQNLKNGVLRGELLPVEEVEEAISAVLVAVRAKMLTLPTKAAPMVLGAQDAGETRNTLTIQVHEALSDLSDSAPIIADAIHRARKRLGRLGLAFEGDGSSEAAATADRQ